MPFTLMHGTYHLVSRNEAGVESGFQPDGDSMQFQPGTAAVLGPLGQLEKPYQLNKIRSAQLRFEGVDALGLHFQGGATPQPRPVAGPAPDFLTRQLMLNPVPY